MEKQKINESSMVYYGSDLKHTEQRQNNCNTGLIVTKHIDINIPCFLFINYDAV